MTDDLYERYKEALRVGHVAVLRGALEEALAAYRTAASIAPSRALPHTSLGGVLLRLGHLEEALVEYAAAVARAPHDEGALLGQAEALTTAGQRVDAAQALDHVSEIQEASGRLPEAADTLRRALELEDAPERARHQRGLLREIRLSAGDQAAEQLLARALRLRDEPPAAPSELPRSSVPGGLIDRVKTGSGASADSPYVTSPTGDVSSAADANPAAESGWFDAPLRPAAYAAGEPSDIGQETDHGAAAIQSSRSKKDLEWPAADFAQSRREPLSIVGGLDDRSTTHRPETRPEEPPRWAPAASKDTTTPEPAASPTAQFASETPIAVEPILAAVGVMDLSSFDADPLVGPVGETQHQPTGDELLVAAEAADLSGDGPTLRSLLLWTARAYAREGRFEAALDAAHRLLQKSPGDVDAHLVLVELYIARDWNGLAAEKLALLGRLAELNNDQETRQRLCAVASRAFPKDERLGSLCA